jgi:hypothetical protein
VTTRGLRPVPLLTVLGHQVALGYLVDGDVTIAGSIAAAVWLSLGLLAVHAYKLDGLSVWWAVHTGPKKVPRQVARLRAARARRAGGP